MDQALAVLLFLAAPAVILLLVRHVNVARAPGPIVLCCVTGLLIGLTGLLRESTDPTRLSVTKASLAPLPERLMARYVQWKARRGGSNRDLRRKPDRA